MTGSPRARVSRCPRCASTRPDVVAVTNVVAGSGGGLLQKINRDTIRFAIKANLAVVVTELVGPVAESLGVLVVIDLPTLVVGLAVPVQVPRELHLFNFDPGTVWWDDFVVSFSYD